MGALATKVKATPKKASGAKHRLPEVLELLQKASTRKTGRLDNDLRDLLWNEDGETNFHSLSEGLRDLIDYDVLPQVLRKWARDYRADRSKFDG